MLRQDSSVAVLPPGTYLFGAQPSAASRSFVELQFDLAQILRRVQS